MKKLLPIHCSLLPHFCMLLLWLPESCCTLTTTNSIKHCSKAAFIYQTTPQCKSIDCIPPALPTSALQKSVVRPGFESICLALPKTGNFISFSFVLKRYNLSQSSSLLLPVPAPWLSSRSCHAYHQCFWTARAAKGSWERKGHTTGYKDVKDVSVFPCFQRSLHNKLPGTGRKETRLEK